MLSVTVATTPTTATVGFMHANPVGIVRYEASVYGQSAIRCSVEATAKPLQCTLKGLPEASVFVLEATACLASHCEPPGIGPWRTSIRGNKVSIEEPSLGGECWVYFGQSPHACTYKDLKPGQKYKFMYRLEHWNVVSENRFKVYTMPAVCKLRCPTLGTFIYEDDSLRMTAPNVMASYIFDHMY